MADDYFARRSLWLIVPPLALATLDWGITLYCQTPAYWAGNYSDVREISPSFAYYLSIHPLVFVTVVALWMLIFCALIVLLPEWLALTLAITILIGNTIGATSWITYRFGAYQISTLVVLATAGLTVIAFKRGQASDGQSAFNWERTGLPNWGRWIMIVLLSLPPIWWFIIPHQ